MRMAAKTLIFAKSPDNSVGFSAGTVILIDLTLKEEHRRRPVI